jgi:CubicO group peptidase (beta-lactamase class C family)
MAPLKLGACFNWSGCDASAAARAVVLYRADASVARDELHGSLPTCPVIPAADGSCDLAAYTPGWNGALFSPQGGLRISMRDLAKVGQLLARGGRGFLSPAAFAALTTPQWRFDGTNGLGEDGAPDGFFCAYGLAVQLIGSGSAGCHDEPFGDGVPRLGHPGEAYGLRSGLWVDPKTGRGVAFFTTAVADDAPKGASAFTAAEEAVLARVRSSGYPQDKPPR